jgi:MFS-type transporter involved in bile tolerance (Atg22 family)
VTLRPDTPLLPEPHADARRRAVSGFTLYDVANSAFVTTVVTAVGGPFLTAIAEEAARDDGGSCCSASRRAPRRSSRTP